MPSGTSSPLVDELPPRPSPPLTVGISECLLGTEVRYDGSGARSSLPHESLAGLFVYRGICPEVGIGMGVPRAPIRLVRGRPGHGDEIRVVGVADDGEDFTKALRGFGAAAADRLDDVAGYVFMKNSPSCGLYRVKVYTETGGRVSGAPDRSGRGIYADALARALPLLPMEDCGRLFDDVLRENFVMRAFAYAHFRSVASAGLSARRLIEFHSRYKYLLMAHSVPHYQAAGRLLSDLRGDLAGKAARYFAVLMEGLSRPASRGGHANVLAHLSGYVKRVLDGPSRQELATLIQGYRRGEQPLLAPIALLKHHLKRHGDAYVTYQTYLDPHPEAAGLRRTL
jgi:uncharacterized protein YbgA (DUF1722 family)/uncharacterized protein YbbK (DUF523 family)